MPKDKPAHVVRLGAIKATIWRNESDKGVYYSTTLSRSYRERGSEQWKESDSFMRDELLAASKAADMAHTWILEQATHGSAAANPPDDRDEERWRDSAPKSRSGAARDERR